MGASVQRVDSPSLRSDRAPSTASCSDFGGATDHGTLGDAGADLDVSDALSRTEKRVGQLAVWNRYHRLPRRVTDDYAIEGYPLGDGYSGTVRSAVCLRTNVACAVKRLRLRDLQPAQKRDLVSEIEVFLTMDHPNVVRLLNVYETEQSIYIVMECLSGGMVLDRIRENRGFNEEDAAETVRQMLLATAYIHTEGIVHRDLKLENFMYEKEGSDVVKMIDFGFSRFFDQSGRRKFADNPGTVTYVAPEVLASNYGDCKCDMWSLGVCAFALLCGGKPFDEWDPELRRKIRKGRYSMWQTKWRRVSNQAKDFVSKLLVVSGRKRMTAEQALLHPWIARLRVKAPSAEALAAEAAFASSCLQYARSASLNQAYLRQHAWSMPGDERNVWRSAYLDIVCSSKGVLPLNDLEAVLRRHVESEDDFDEVVAAVAAMGADGDGALRFSDFVGVSLAGRAEGRSPATEATPMFRVGRKKVGLQEVEDARKDLDRFKLVVEGDGPQGELDEWTMDDKEPCSPNPMRRVDKSFDWDALAELDEKELSRLSSEREKKLREKEAAWKAQCMAREAELEEARENFTFDWDGEVRLHGSKEAIGRYVEALPPQPFERQ